MRKKGQRPLIGLLKRLMSLSYSVNDKIFKGENFCDLFSFLIK